MRKITGKAVLFPLLYCAMFMSCKHEPELVLPEGGSLTPLKAVVRTGDSILFNVSGFDANYDVALKPDIGIVKSSHWYIAPSTLLSDSTRIILEVSDRTRKLTADLLLIRSDPDDTIISFQKTVFPLFVSNCNFSGCHGNGSKAGKVDLSDYINTMKHVVPYHPERSLVFQSMLKTDPLRRMPPAGPLHAYKIRYISKWIEQGGVDN